MGRKFSEVAFTPSVQAVQDRMGSRESYALMKEKMDGRDVITPDLSAFLSQRDSFYLGTSNSDGQPYIQHRGGPEGFLKVLDERTLAFADFSGNRQYITAGNLSENDKAFIFLMDYANRRRIKIWGRAEVVEDDTELMEKLIDPAYEGRPERAIRFHVDAWDANCPQHIQPRLTEKETNQLVTGLQNRILELESEVEELQKNRQVTKN